jgi:hypothetical protein
MSGTLLFVCGLGLTVAASLSAVLYLRYSLHQILIELCGTAERASFWTVFSTIAVSLVPLIFAMQSQPEFAPGRPLVFELANQVKWGLVGLVLSLVVLAWIISRFIPRVPVNRNSAQDRSKAA